MLFLNRWLEVMHVLPELETTSLLEVLSCASVVGDTSFSEDTEEGAFVTPDIYLLNPSVWLSKIVETRRFTIIV